MRAARTGPLVALVSAMLAVAACAKIDEEAPAEHRVLTGDPGRGRLLIVNAGCGACHVVPGVEGADGIVGPSLENFGRRALIGGVVPNRPEMLALWVRNAPALAPDTGMPELPLTDAQARDVAAYLYTLR